MVGLLLNNLHNDFFVPLLNGVESVVSQKGYNLIVATYHAAAHSMISITNIDSAEAWATLTRRHPFLERADR